MVIFGIFAFFVVAAVMVFANLSGGGGGGDIGEVRMWGSFDQRTMDIYLRELSSVDERAINIVYQEVPADVFQSTLAEALANGNGPDLFILDQSNILQHWNKILPFSYEAISQRQYKDTYIGESELFLSGSGISALPFSIDPLVLYWNRDIFSEAGFASPPAFWDELFLLAERITKRDKANNIELATIAFGEFDNVNNAKDILSALIMQAGGDIMSFSSDGQLYPSLTEGSISNAVNPTQTALRFYTEFADPIKSVYSWNRSLPNSLEAFSQGTLALYIGYASEVEAIQARNGNLNFDVAPLPQVRAGEQKRVLTFGKMYALAVPVVARNAAGGVQMAFLLTGQDSSDLLTQAIGIPSPRRDLLGDIPDDPVDVIFRSQALISSAWLDPNAEDSAQIFRRMIGGVTSGSLRISDAISRADAELTLLLAQ